MKLLFVLPEYGLNVGGGIATFYRHLLPELVRRGHSVRVVLASMFTNEPPPSSDGVVVESVERHEIEEGLGRFSSYAVVPELQRQMALAWAAWRKAGAGNGFDVVETTDWGMLFVPWVVERDRPPVVVQLNGSNGQIDYHDPIEGNELQGRLARFLEMTLLREADELQTYGLTNAREWSDLLARPVEYIPPGWQVESLPVSAAAGAVQKLDGLVVGRIQCWKGATVLCGALRRLGSLAPQVGWVGGDTSFRQRTSSFSVYLAKTFPDVWGVRVRPLGKQSTAQTGLLQSSAGFVAVPSTWDVFNLAAVEGMGRGRVVLCSEGAGAAQLIQDGVNGLRVPPGDESALAEGLRRVCTLSPVEKVRMGESARQTVERELDPGRVADLRLERYRLLVSGAAPKPPCHPWKRDAAAGGEMPEPMRFLDKLPLRKLARYVLRRGWSRLFGKPLS